MTQTSTEGKQRLTGITVMAVLPYGVLDILSLEWVFEFGGENGQAVEEQPQVEAFLVLFAEIQLSDDRELVGFVKSLRLFVESRGWPEIGELELAPGC